MPTRNLTIMFTDIKGFTERTSRETRHGIVNYIETHNNLLLPVIRHYGGTVVKTIGDAFLVHFDSPTDGVLCGLTIQEVLRQYNAKAAAPDERVNVRVAINVGDVELKDSDVLGEPVNVAARLEGITEAGDVYFTEAVYLAMNRKEVPSTEIGERTFAGISTPIRIYKVIQDETSAQNRKIAQSVQWAGGLPVLSGKPIAASSTASASAVGASSKPQSKISGYLLAAMALIALAVVMQIIQRGSAAPEKPAAAQTTTVATSPVQQAEKLLAAGEALSAFEAADKYLLEHPDNTAARDIAVKAARQQIDNLIARHNKDDALAWVLPLAERRQYLQSGLGSKLAALECEVTTVAALRKHGTRSGFWDEVRRLLKKYPADPEAPYAVATVMKHSIMPEVLLHLYKESITRGHAPDAAMFECIDVTLKRNLPESDYAKEAHALAQQHFAADAERWAIEVIEKAPAAVPENASDFSLLNALQILEPKQHAAAKDAFYQNLRAAREGKRLAEIQQVLLQNTEPKKNRQALLLIQSLVNDSDVKQDIRDNLRPILTQLKQKDGGF